MAEESKNTRPLEANLPQESFMDPLLDCLLILNGLQGRSVSPHAVTAGLPLVQNKLTPQLFVYAAERTGFAARIMRKWLHKISDLVLPAVLILKENRACILNKVFKDGTAEIIWPESGGGASTISLNQLNQDYSGFVIFMKPFCHLDRRANEYHITSRKSWFWSIFWQYRGFYAQVVLAAFMINLFALATPLFIMNVYDRVIPNFAKETLWVLAIGVAIVIVFDFLIRTLRGYLIDVAGKKADIALAGTLFQKVLNVQMACKPSSSGAFANQFKEFEVLRDFFTSATVTTLVDLPFVLIFVMIIGSIGGKIALIPLLAIPIVFLGAYLFEIPVRRSLEKAIFGATQQHALLVESINGLETIKTLSAEGVLQRKWNQFVGLSAQAGLRSRFFSSLAINFTAFNAHLVTIAIMFFGVYLIAANHLTVGGLVACVILNGRALAPLSSLASIITRLNRSRLALKNLTKIMALPVERPQGKKFIHGPIFRESIEFRKVSFKYPEQDSYALKDLSFKIQAGEKVAILGPMGSGKSTIEKLLLGLYYPLEGSIFIDGIDLTQIDPADLRRNIGYVSQDFALLYGDVHSNISLGAPLVSDRAILQAAKMTGVDKFVSQHPAGYAMPIGEQGVGLSGGQRQSIAIARAVISNPPLLLLDEPTSAIDMYAEQLILHHLMQFIENKTLLVITHKFSLLALVNRILVISGGQLIADGTKEDILKQMQKEQEIRQQEQMDAQKS